MSHVNGNTMYLSHLHDFYYLDALRAGITMAIANNPEIAFRHSVERLENDVEIALSEISHNIALRLYVYLWATALGEARHARDLCKDSIKQLRNADRNTTYTKSLDFFPSDKNVEILTHIYTQKWSSGSFGGNAWLDITEGMKLYGKVSHGTFIDHVVDLEHNGGTIFSKSPDNVQLNTNHYYPSKLRNFLNFKFARNILQDSDCWTTEVSTQKIPVTRKVYALVVRYSNIIETIQAVDFLAPELESLTDFSVEWGYNEFELNEGRNEPEGDLMECEECGRYRVHEDHKHINGFCVCNSCYNRFMGRREERTYTCDNCETETADELHYVDGEDESWCDDCVDNYMQQCEDCHYDKHIDHMVFSDDQHNLCEKCARRFTCSECGEIHYQDMTEHDLEKHYTPAELPVDSDGIFETVENFSWLPAKTEVWYQWDARTGIWHTCESIDAHKQAEAFEQLGAKTCIKTIKTFTPFNQDPLTTEVWDSGKGLFVYCNRTYHNRDIYVIMAPNMLWAGNPSKSTLWETLDIMHKMLPIIDWNTIQTKEDWRNLPSETIEKIKKAVYGV